MHIVPSRPFVPFALLIMSFLLCLGLSSCSRSKWLKNDGQPVSAKEQLVCAEEIRAQNQGRVLAQEELMGNVEDCMLAKGYYPRPWWLLYDFEWEGKPLVAFPLDN